MSALAACAPVAQDGEAGLADRIGGVQAFVESAFVQRAHPHARRAILYGPQAHDHGAGAGDLERAPETEHAFAGPDFTEASVAGGKDSPFEASQIHGSDLLSRQDAIFIVGTGGRTTIGPCEGQSREQERIVWL